MTEASGFKMVALAEFQGEERKSLALQVEEIFFLSTSVKTFSSEEKRQNFFKRWCGDYLTFYPEEFFLVLDAKAERLKVLGYLSGCSDSMRALEVLDVPGLAVFQDLFSSFPAHLHINFHPDSRGMGLGHTLIKHYLVHLERLKIPGIHLVTSKDARNVTFYERLGFNQNTERDFKEMPLYFMGRIL